MVTHEIRKDLSPFAEALLFSSILMKHSAALVYDVSNDEFVYRFSRSMTLSSLIDETVLWSILKEEKTIKVKALLWDALHFLQHQPSDEQPYFLLSFNVKVRKGMRLNIQMVPHSIENGKPKLLFCTISFATVLNPNIYIRNVLTLEVWEYYSEIRRFKQKSPVILRYEEVVILTQSMLGLKTKEIASILCKSPETIKDYKESLYKKMGVVGMAEAIAYATLHGLV